ncbi:hypothetical protein [Dyadobacter crusticola]|uniref:hypothetical protein n=1 Tax=Dyadobacter crusticola TaxID=292407 RepID=UPI0004E21C49|nr:hypothetical protein [Dyadobacter crusticola]
MEANVCKSTMRLLIATVLFILLVPCPGYSQHEADHWFFGRGVGLSFATGKPMPVYGSPIKHVEGTAVASDSKSGKLLFYTDGRTVWNAAHELMSNGEGLAGSFTSAQSALVLPYPSKPGLFYLFTTRSYADNKGGLAYSIVDMHQSERMGAVAADRKNIPLEKFGSEKLTAVQHANKRDFWLISHKWDSDIFLVYLVSPSGISPAKENQIGTVHKKAGPDSDHYIGEELGSLKASPNGRLLAAAVFGQESRPFELYDFDNQTGTISNFRSLGNFAEQYSLSFSPDNSKLYLSLFNDHGAFQFDLKKPNTSPSQILSPDIKNDNPTYVGGSMQLGPDGKLYMACIDRTGLLVINSPNSNIGNIDVNELHLDLKGGRIYQGLPNFLQSTFNTSPELPYSPETSDCGQDLLVFPNPLIGNKFTVQMDSAAWRPACKLLRFKAYVVSGTELLSTDYQINDNFEVDATFWPAGLYILVFEYPHKSVIRKLVRL